MQAVGWSLDRPFDFPSQIGEMLPCRPHFLWAWMCVSLTAVKALSLEGSRGSVNTMYRGLDPHIILLCAIPTLTVACQTPLSMGFLQARILEWVAISSPRGSPRPRDRTCVSCVSCIAGRFFILWPSGKPKTNTALGIQRYDPVVCTH